jgi:23S rRNA pseudouridine2605 synthase
MAQPPSYDFFKKKSKKTEKGTKEDKSESNEIRLNRYIAKAGIASRREADELIAQGLVKVNGQVVTELGTKVQRTDTVVYEGKKLNPERLVYVLLNKPKDFITTTDDPEDRRTVMELVANACEERIYPVGRLDRNTTGLLLLTNDGELAKKLSHPSHQVKKVYHVLLDRPITPEDYEAIEQGLELEDGLAKVDDLAVLSPDRTAVGMEIHIGRNRIVRRMFEHLGYNVERLDRVTFAGLSKKDLDRGRWRYLTEKEVIRLKHFN